MRGIMVYCDWLWSLLRPMQEIKVVFGVESINLRFLIFKGGAGRRGIETGDNE